jgi:pretoxin HINT domain-containing protein
VIRHTGLHTMVAITLLGGAVLHATDHHLLWNASSGGFSYADALKAGDRLAEPSDHLIPVTRTRIYRADLTAYNLTISGIHTYYVLAGAAPVLVHNDCGVRLPGDGNPEPPPGATRVYRFHTGDDPATLQPKLSAQPPEVQKQVLNDIMDPEEFDRVAMRHMTVADTERSPFVSVTTNPAAAAATTDPELLAITTGVGENAVTKMAPSLSSFIVRNDWLIAPDATNALSQLEGEYLWMGDDLGDYLEETIPNPFSQK